MKKLIGLFMAMLVVMSFPLAFAEEQEVDVALEADVSIGDETSDSTNGSTGDSTNEETSDNLSDDAEADEDSAADDSEDTDGTTDEGDSADDVDSDGSADDSSEADDAADDSADTDDGNATDDETEDDAGVTPDSPLWGIERALERIDLALTLNKASKAKKGLAHARERLAEVQLMIAAKKAAHADKAQQAHDEDLAGVEEAVDDLESDGNSEVAEETLGEVSEIRVNLTSHAAKVAEVKDRILARQRTKMTAEQIAHLEKVFEKIKAKAVESEQKASAKREKVKTKLKALGELTDEQVDELVQKVEERRAKAKSGERAESDDAEVEVQERTRVKVDGDKAEIKQEVRAKVKADLGEGKVTGKATVSESKGGSGSREKSGEKSGRD